MAGVTFLLIGQISVLTLICSSGVPTLSASLGGMISHHRVKRETDKVNTSIAGFSEEEKMNILNKHNEFRKIPDASNMCAMIWDETLATKAQGWADQCILGPHNPDRTIIGSSDIAGENVHARSGTYNEVAAIQDLYDEVGDYIYELNACINVCGHYTQIVWATSSRVGCGIKYCPTTQNVNFNNVYITVCNYAPTGNYIGQTPYLKGAACTACSEEKPHCDDGLCSDALSTSTTTEPPTTTTTTETTSTSTTTETTSTSTTVEPTSTSTTVEPTSTSTTVEPTSTSTTTEPTTTSTTTEPTSTSTTVEPTSTSTTVEPTSTSTTTEPTTTSTTTEPTSTSTTVDPTSTSTTTEPTTTSTTTEPTSTSTTVDPTSTSTTTSPTPVARVSDTTTMTTTTTTAGSERVIASAMALILALVTICLKAM